MITSHWIESLEHNKKDIKWLIGFFLIIASNEFPVA